MKAKLSGVLSLITQYVLVQTLSLSVDRSLCCIMYRQTILHRHVQCSPLKLIITGILTTFKMLIAFQLSVVYSFLSFASLYILTSHLCESLCYIQNFVNIHRFYYTKSLGVTMLVKCNKMLSHEKTVSPETERIFQFS